MIYIYIRVTQKSSNSLQNSPSSFASGAAGTLGTNEDVFVGNDDLVTWQLLIHWNWEIFTQTSTC